MEKLKETILERSIFKKASKHTILLEEEGICDNIVYLKNGITRHFLLDHKGIDITKNFTVGPSFVLYSISSFLTKTGSQVQFEAISDIEYYELAYDDYLELMKSTEFVSFWNSMLTNFILKKEKKEISLLKYDAVTRYSIFLEDFPGLLNKIPHYYIASYLSITPETLSRIRKTIS